MKEQCSNCRFWRGFPAEGDDEEVHGVCRRYPPVFSGRPEHSDFSDNWNQPITANYEGCGEWKPPTAKEVDKESTVVAQLTVLCHEAVAEVPDRHLRDRLAQRLREIHEVSPPVAE